MNAIRTMLTVALATAVLIGTGGLAGAVAATTGGEIPSEADAGPPSDLPNPVPDFVGEILSSIGESLSDGIDDLGKTVSDIAGNGTDEGPVESGD